MEPLLQNIRLLALDWGVRLLGALAIFIIGRWLAGKLSGLAERLLRRARVDQTLVTFAGHLSYGALLLVVLLAALSRLGIETTSLVAIIGAAGLAIGLALQGSLSNFASGIMLILFKPFRVGDAIDGGGASGVVEEIHIFTTRLRTGDNKLIIVPNAKLTADNVVNHSAKGTRRVDLQITVGYQEDLGRVRAILQELLASDARTLREPAPEIGVLQLGENGVALVVRPWVNAADYWAVYFDTLQRIKERFATEGIRLSAPPRTLLVQPEGP